MPDKTQAAGKPNQVGAFGANIYCIGRNYAEHAAELGNQVPEEPVVFIKATSSLRPLSAGPLAFADETFHHEAELVLKIGTAVPLNAEADWSVVDSVALGIDLTRREVQNRLKAKGLPWTIAKSFAGSAIVGDFVARERFSNLDTIHFAFDVNGERRQTGDSSLMIFKVPVLLEYLATLSPLIPGDLVFTGTPAGVGPLRKGDRLKLSFLDVGVTMAGVL